MELLSTGPITLNRRGTKVRSVLHCEDGDPVCDRDGARDGVCTFGVSLCFGNLDPRLESCKSRSVRSVKIIRPRKLRGAGVGGRNATRLRRALEALGLDVRERSRVITHPGEPLGYNRCSQTIELAVPAPRGKQKKSVRRTFQLRATAVDGSRDKDRFVFHCR
jgi:hypothetical protein